MLVDKRGGNLTERSHKKIWPLFSSKLMHRNPWEMKERDGLKSQVPQQKEETVSGAGWESMVFLFLILT